MIIFILRGGVGVMKISRQRVVLRRRSRGVNLWLESSRAHSAPQPFSPEKSNDRAVKALGDGDP